jgi:ATP-dependent helicase/DNAse subunit B
MNIKDNIILILPNNIKVNTIKKIRTQGLYNIKFMSLEELEHKFYFTYNNETIYYLMTKYNYKYDIAKMYLENLFYLENNDFSNSKLIKLRELKEELDKNNLLIYDNLFKNYLKEKELVLYGYNNLNKYYTKLIEKLKKITKVTIIEDNREDYNHLSIYEFSSILEEVTFVAESICHNINSNIPINNIKICFTNNEYLNTIKRIFKLYNIPLELDNSYLYSTKLVKYFLDNLDSDINITLEKVESNFNLKNLNNQNIYNQIISILNNYTFCSDYLTIKDMLVHDFKTTKITKIKLEKSIKIIDNLENISSEDYVYLMDFNQGDIPRTYKDEDYLSDNIKKLLKIDTSNDLNRLSLRTNLYNINKTKNLTITYKLSSPNGTCYLSSLNDYLFIPITNKKAEYKYSNLYNKLILSENIDTYLKYNEKDNNLDKLSSTYPDLSYGTYNNTFTGIDKNKMQDYLNHKLSLSYSTINDYYHCSFKYYLSNILNLNIFKETFMTILGNTFHYILSICFKKEDIDISLEYDNYLNKVEYPFSSKEKYFLENLKEELIFIISSIKKQYQYNSLNNTYYEEKITIDKSTTNLEIIFKGYIDKLMLDEDNRVGAIIDYKTGNPNLDLNNAPYGLDLQLPVYIYLTKNRFPNIRIVGFYLQKILNNKIKRDEKHTYEELKLDNLKLQGYTNSNENLIKVFDSSYNESQVIKGMKTSSKGLNTKKVLDDVKIDRLSNIVDEKINEAIENISSAKFSINPKRIGNVNVGCKYCQYKDICYMNEKDIINLKEYKDLEFLND